MIRFNIVAMVLFLLTVQVVHGDRQIRSTDRHPSNFPPFLDQVTISDLTLVTSGNNLILYWSPARRLHPSTNKQLCYYKILSSADGTEFNLLRKTSKNTLRITEKNCLNRFYQVIAIYNDRSHRKRLPDAIQDVGIILQNFEDEELNLLPLDEDEDVDPDGWEITDAEALPDSDHSLHLTGNCWKKLEVERAGLDENSVWSIGVLSDRGNRQADLHVFGIGDGSEELYYVFYGSRLYWDEKWIVKNQNVWERGEWHIFNLAVGYDWKIRYGYLPSIDELYFISDNDNNFAPITVYFDQLLDITGTIAPVPKPKARWRINRNMEGQGTGVEFIGDVDNREADEVSFHWDFGDGSQSSSQNPVHFFRSSGVYSVGMTATDDENRKGYVKLNVEIGEVQLFNSISACFTGDIMLGRRYEQNNGIIRRFGPEYVFEEIQSLTSSTDLTVINLECLLTDEGTPHPTKGISFRSNPNNVAGLTYAGVDIALLGNNHMSDYGRRGLEETLEVLDAAGIGYSGAGMNEYDALQPVFRTVKGVRIGFLAYCNRTGRDYNDAPFLDAGYDSHGYAYFSLDNLHRSVPPAASQCDQLVIYVHGGREYEIAPTGLIPEESIHPFDEQYRLASTRRDSATRELSHIAIDLGADLVIGGHPHVIQGMEVYNNAVIAHSMGNFAFDQNFFETWPSILVQTEMTRESIYNVWFEPIFVNNYRPTPATGALGRKIIDRMAGYSYELNAVIVPDYENLKAIVVLEPENVQRSTSEQQASGEMRYIEEDRVYRSNPIKLEGGFPSKIISVSPDAIDRGWRVSLGSEILLVGNMESEGADIWNYNSNVEGKTDQNSHSGEFSSFLIRQQRWQDGVTDLIQRIPININEDRLTLSGWMNTVNARDAGLAARFYMSRYNNDQTGEHVAEGRFQGDNDWFYIWDQVVIPDRSEFVNVRWQMWGADEGQNQLWADDVELIRWEEFQDFEGNLGIDHPNDLYYLQVETRYPLDNVEVTYETVTLNLR